VSANKPEHLLASYALGGLNAEERKNLFQAALSDQELFDRLVEEEQARLALQQPENRALLLNAMREEPAPTFLRHLAAWFRQPRYLALSAVAAVALTITILVWTSPAGNRLAVSLDPTRAPTISMLSVETTEPGRAPQPDSSQLFRLPVKRQIAARLGLNKPGNTPEYRIGEPIRIGLSIANDANCLLFDRQADQPAVRLFPNRFTSNTTVRGSETVFIPPAGQGNMIVGGPPGLHQLRLIVVPPDVALDLSAPASWADKATVVQQDYRVLPQRSQ
jgi:hypothetical protein